MLAGKGEALASPRVGSVWQVLGPRQAGGKAHAAQHRGEIGEFLR